MALDLRRRLRARLTDENGSVTFEAMLWLPIFVFVLWLVADASIIFGSEARILRVVQDANRMYASGYFQTAAQTEKFINDKLSAMSSNLQISTTENNKIIRTVVTVPVSDLTASGTIGAFTNMKVSIASEQMSEG